jgi:hypothetical protein
MYVHCTWPSVLRKCSTEGHDVSVCLSIHTYILVHMYIRICMYIRSLHCLRYVHKSVCMYICSCIFLSCSCGEFVILLAWLDDWFRALWFRHHAKNTQKCTTYVSTTQPHYTYLCVCVCTRTYMYMYVRVLRCHYALYVVSWHRIHIWIYIHMYCYIRLYTRTSYIGMFEYM